MTDPKLPGQYKCSGHPLQILPNNSYLPRPAGPNWSTVISLQVSAQSLSTTNTKTGFLEYQFQRKTIKHNATTTSHLIFCGWLSTKFNKRNWQTTNNIFDNRQNRKFLEKGQSWSKTSGRVNCVILLNNVINQKINRSGDIFQCLGQKFDEKFYCHWNGWSYGPNWAVWGIFSFGFSLKKIWGGHKKFQFCTPLQ